MNTECRTQQTYPLTNQVFLDPPVHINTLSHPSFNRTKLSQQFNICDCLAFQPCLETNRVSDHKINKQAELCNKKTSNKQGAVLENAYFVGNMLLKEDKQQCDDSIIQQHSTTANTITEFV
jgi:hypothetical protein